MDAALIQKLRHAPSIFRVDVREGHAAFAQDARSVVQDGAIDNSSFEGGAAESRKGETALETVLRELVERG